MLRFLNTTSLYRTHLKGQKLVIASKMGLHAFYQISKRETFASGIGKHVKVCKVSTHGKTARATVDRRSRSQGAGTGQPRMPVANSESICAHKADLENRDLF